MTALRVVLLTQWYSPEPIHQPEWIAHGLMDQGAVVDVVTGVPNYPTGRTVTGYRAWRGGSEVIRGVRVRRTPLFPNHGTNAVLRMVNYLSWAFSSALLGTRTIARSDVVLVYFSPATAALAAVVSRLRSGTPFVLLVQDVWPDSITESGFLPGMAGRAARVILTRLVNAAYRHAAAIVVTSPGMRSLLIDRGVAPEKLTLIYNWMPDDERGEEGCPGLRDEPALTGEDFVVMYAGNHGAAQGLAAVVDAFARVPRNDRVHLVLVGDGIEKDNLRARRGDEHPRIHFLEPQDRSTVAAWMREADAQLVSLADRPLFRVTTPSKLQASLAAGQPILVHANGDAADIVEQAGAGVAAAPGDQGALLRAIARLRGAHAEERRGWGVSGRQFYEQHMAAKVGAHAMLGLLSEATKPVEVNRDREACH